MNIPATTSREPADPRKIFKDPRKAAYLNSEGVDKPLRSPIPSRR